MNYTYTQKNSSQKLVIFGIKKTNFINFKYHLRTDIFP